MKIIRFEEDNGRILPLIPFIKEVPGMEGWIEIRGISNFTVNGIDGELIDLKFREEQIVDNVVITVDGVSFTVEKETLVPTIPEVEVIEVPVWEGGTGGGADGSDGVNGKSAYELAVQEGYKGTLTEWLASLKGETGPAGANGKDGTNGKDGSNGADGKSAYQSALDTGFVGTEAEWIASLKGATGPAGKDGSNGTNGKDGATGAIGPDGLSAYQIAVNNGFEGTEEEWLESLEGLSAYEVAVKNGYEGTEEEWLESLKASAV